MFCPTLESLCLDAVAENVNTYEPAALSLPCGGGARIIDRLASTNRLRPETLGPLLQADWASADELRESLGSKLVVSAPGCRGLSALAAQRLKFAACTSSVPATASMPRGTRGHTTSAAALEAR